MKHQYKERYLFLIDILGSRTLIDQSVSNPIIFEKLKKAVCTLLDMRIPPHFSDLSSKEIDITDNHCSHYFSDHIVMTAAGTEQGLRKILYQLRYITGYLLEQGIFTRGAITKGLIFDDFQVVFGPAIVEAYILESEIAIYPRVIASENIITDLKVTNRYVFPQQNLKFIEDFKRDNDNIIFFDSLKFKPIWGGKIKIVKEKTEDQPAIGEWEGIPTREEWLKKIKGHVIDALNSCSDPKIRQKYEWYKTYFNNSLCSKDKISQIN